MALVLSGTDGVSGVDGTASNPSLEGTDSNTGVFFPAADTVAIGTGGTERLRVDSAGNAGLGVTPSAWSGFTALQIQNGALFTDSTSFRSIMNGYYNGTNWIYSTSNAATRYEQVNGIHRWFNAPSGTAGNAITFTQAMTLDASGNLGIGTTTLNQKLNIYGDGTNYSALINFDRGGVYTAQIGTDGVGAIFGSTSNHLTRFITNNTERARITSDGDFLIGTTTGGSKLSVSDSNNRTEATAQFRIGGSGYSIYQWLDGTAAYIGQDSGSRSFRIYSSAETAGVNLAAGGTSWGTFSDERLKYDIEPIVDGLTKLANMRCVSYRLKDVDAEDSQKKLGVIAQDLVGVVDEVIDITKRSGDDTEYMSVRYTELTPVLIKAIQEQQAMIDELKAKVAALENA